jgi:nitrite reductase/ring-hydroxylating ferredoxin subunit
VTVFQDAGPADLREGELRGVRIDGRAVLLARVEGCLYAVDGVCTHMDALLEEGELDGR